MREDHINILMHGHSPVMAEKVIEKINSPEIQALARQEILRQKMGIPSPEVPARAVIPSFLCTQVSPPL